MKTNKNGKLGKRDLKTAVANLAAGLNGNGGQVHIEVEKPRMNKKRGADRKKIVATATTLAPAIPVKVVIAPPPITQPVKPAPSLLDEILRAGNTDNKLAEAISMANTILTNEKSVAAFVGAVSAGDALFIQKLAFNRHEDEVRAELRVLSLQQLERNLQDWNRRGDEAAGRVIATLNTFRKSTADVVTPLWQLYVEIVRPAMEVQSYYGLSQLLKQLFAKGLVEKVGWHHYPERTVVLKDTHSSTGYLPAKNRGSVIPIIEAAWPWVKRAEERAAGVADERRGELAEMEKQATGLTPQAALSGEDGKIFFQTGMSSGALLHIGDHRIRVEKTIGMRLRSTGWMNLDAGPKAFQDIQIFNLFFRWKKGAKAQAPVTPVAPAIVETSAQTAE